MAKITAALNPTLDLFPILSRFPPQPCGAPLTGIARLAAESSPPGDGHRMELRSLAVRSVLNRSVSRRGVRRVFPAPRGAKRQVRGGAGWFQVNKNPRGVRRARLPLLLCPLYPRIYAI